MMWMTRCHPCRGGIRRSLLNFREILLELLMYIADGVWGGMVFVAVAEHKVCTEQVNCDVC
jgi:hypothetical protein